MMTKLWLDDVRPAPYGWEWARTVTEAKMILLANEVEECSLDHDLGYDGPPPGACENCDGTGKVWEPCYQHGHLDYCPSSCTWPGEITCGNCDGDGFTGGDLMYVAGTSEETGLTLVKWMVHENRVPPKVTIHSWNPSGAASMASYIAQAGMYDVIKPVPVIIAPYVLPSN